MGSARLQFIGPDSRSIELAVRIADESREIAAGFQHLCPEVAQDTSILFLFRVARIPSFHMNNVYMPLDIAFIDQKGRIRDVMTMRPYIAGIQSRPLWSPQTPVIAALEVREGFFQEQGITEQGWSIRIKQ